MMKRSAAVVVLLHQLVDVRRITIIVTYVAAVWTCSDDEFITKAFHGWEQSRRGRDGTVLTCLAGNKMKTGRDGKIMKSIVAWMGRDGKGGVNFVNEAGLYSAMTFLFHDGTGQ